MPWYNLETAEITDQPPDDYVCPTCEGYSRIERELRVMRTKITRLENEADHALVAKRDGKVWKDLLAYWQATFPDRRITSKGIKSARATKVFQRLEAGATVEDIQYAVTAAKLWSYVVYGRRVKSGSKSDLAVDLEQIVSVGNDHQFDTLVELGRMIEEAGPGW